MGEVKINNSARMNWINYTISEESETSRNWLYKFYLKSNLMEIDN